MRAWARTDCTRAWEMDLRSRHLLQGILSTLRVSVGKHHRLGNDNGRAGQIRVRGKSGVNELPRRIVREGNVRVKHQWCDRPLFRPSTVVVMQIDTEMYRA